MKVLLAAALTAVAVAATPNSRNADDATHAAPHLTPDFVNYRADVARTQSNMAEYLAKGSRTWSEAEVLESQLALTDPSWPAKFEQWRASHFLQPGYFQSYDMKTNMPVRGIPAIPGVAGRPVPDAHEPAASGDWTPVQLPGGINPEYYLSFAHQYNRYPADSRQNMGARGFLKYMQQPWFQVPMTTPNQARYPASLPFPPTGMPYGHPGVLPGSPIGHFSPSVHAALSGLHSARFAAAPPTAAGAAAPTQQSQPGAINTAGAPIRGALRGAPPSAYRAKRAAMQGHYSSDEQAMHAMSAMANAGLHAALGFDLHPSSEDALASYALAAAMAAHHRDLHTVAGNAYAEEQRQFADSAVVLPAWTKEDFDLYKDQAAGKDFAPLSVPDNGQVDATGVPSGAVIGMGAVERMLAANEANADADAAAQAQQQQQ